MGLKEITEKTGILIEICKMIWISIFTLCVFLVGIWFLLAMIKEMFRLIF